MRDLRNLFREHRPFVALLLVLASCAPQPYSDLGADAAAIEAVLRARLDRHDNRLELGRVEVGGYHAVVDWTQGPTSGRALLELRDGKWVVAFCSGDAPRDSSDRSGI